MKSPQVEPRVKTKLGSKSALVLLQYLPNEYDNVGVNFFI